MKKRPVVRAAFVHRWCLGSRNNRSFETRQLAMRSKARVNQPTPSTAPRTMRRRRRMIVGRTRAPLIWSIARTARSAGRRTTHALSVCGMRPVPRERPALPRARRQPATSRRHGKAQATPCRATRLRVPLASVWSFPACVPATCPDGLGAYCSTRCLLPHRRTGWLSRSPVKKPSKPRRLRHNRVVAGTFAHDDQSPRPAIAVACSLSPCDD